MSGGIRPPQKVQKLCVFCAFMAERPRWSRARVRNVSPFIDYLNESLLLTSSVFLSQDEKYWTRRHKNNEAAKRSRDARRLKENQISVRAAYLERENAALRQEVAEIRKELGRCRSILSKYENRLPDQWNTRGTKPGNWIWDYGLFSGDGMIDGMMSQKWWWRGGWWMYKTRRRSV